MIRLHGFALIMSLMASLAGPAYAQNAVVVNIAPARNALAVPVNAPIAVEFDRPMNLASVTNASFRVFARWGGAVSGTFSLSNKDHTVTLTPDNHFSHGDQVMVVLSHDIQASDGSFLRSAGYSWQFWTRAEAADRDFAQIGSMTTRTIPSQTTRSYGGIASDLDNDGWLDVTVVNEDTADLRVFMNKDDGTGLFDPFIQPPFPVNDRASPSEPADFNNDGFVDICVVNINTNSVSILLGNGDGTFGPQQQITVGSTPRGICVLDADGDGDIDIVNTNSSSSNMSILFNNGAGVFSGPTFFEGGGAGEWALSAADMNSDGILDLVIGARTSQQVLVTRCNGDGTFTNISVRSGAGSVWQMATGDLNGDGHADAATANSASNNCGILLGNGAGALGPPALIATDPFPLGTDLGDLDGDGDLDWINSSYAGDWRVYINNGNGVMAFDQELNAPQAASCVLMFDFDNDGDLDLGLIDELADVLILQKNTGTIAAADINRDGDVNVDDLLAVINTWGACPPPPSVCPADANNSGAVNVDDLLLVINQWGG